MNRRLMSPLQRGIRWFDLSCGSLTEEAALVMVVSNRFVQISIERTEFHLPSGFSNDSNQLIFENEHRFNISNHSKTISKFPVSRQLYLSYSIYNMYT